MIEYVAKVIDFGADSWQTSPTICFAKPTVPALKDALHVFMERAAKRCAGHVYLRMDLPRRPRTTGPRSQNNRFYGHCEDLAEQILDENGEPQFTKQQIHDAMLRMAVADGYPTYLDINGIESPLPSAESSMEQLSLICRVLQKYADTHNLWLHEYVTEGPHKDEVYRSIGGRSFEEMQRYWEREHEKRISR